MPLVPSQISPGTCARVLTAACLLTAATTGLMAQRPAAPVTLARQAYNEQQFDRAIVLAKEAKSTPALADSASLVLSRALLERFRRTGDNADVEGARSALLSVNSAHLTPTEGSELHLGMAELMFVDDQFGTATEMFEVALDRPGMVPDRSRDRVLEWWAASLDRYAQLGPDTQRTAKYWRMLTRLEQEAVRGPASPAVAYWMAAAARAVDDLDRAWSLAIAAWIQAPMIAGARAAALRNDVDRLMAVAIIPERAHHSAANADVEAVKLALTAEWSAIKTKWGDGKRLTSF
ncbi:MAG TPA: hypothetical protein VMZ90_06700 [Vicinamibacterales bacterium]|nr:hypothetical protein [Vicinamibacterales bacterium]